MLNLNDLLIVGKIDPKQVLVFRHVPPEPELRKVLPWFAADRHETFNAYQQTQGLKVEKAMLRAKYVASFIGHRPGKALFVGVYSIGKGTPLTLDEYWQVPAHIEMKKYGMKGFDGSDGRKSILRFDLERLDIYEGWRGKLVVNWPPPGISWWRLSHKTNQITIHAILEDSALESDARRWDELTLNWNDLEILPQRLKTKLREWRGIYYIYDRLDRKGYVGSASGTDNLLGRWLSYRKTGHGGNTLLQERNPENFRFSILELLAPTAPPEEVVRAENSWKVRLSTRSPNGLNDN